MILKGIINAHLVLKNILFELFLKQQDKFIDLPQVIGYTDHKQREYDRIQVTAE